MLIDDVLFRQNCVITVSNDEEAEALQNKLFSVGCGYWDGASSMEAKLHPRKLIAIKVQKGGVLAALEEAYDRPMLENSIKSGVPAFSACDVLKEELSSASAFLAAAREVFARKKRISEVLGKLCRVDFSLYSEDDEKMLYDLLLRVKEKPSKQG